MEDNFALTWEDSDVVQGEEVICSIENEILPAETEEFGGVCEEVVEEEVATEEGVDSENIVYLTEDNVLVMQPGEGGQATFEEQFMECQMAEEIVTEQWDCPEEIVVGSEEAVGGTEDQTNEDFDIPLPTDQDEYTAARPYPCDFCSRRFRKKANLMNHMVAHQTDRPHGCNLCGVRYLRKCDLMNHLKIHAYVPETDGLEDEEDPLNESDSEKRVIKRKQFVNIKRKKKIKQEYNEEDAEDDDDDAAASSSRTTYNYADEDMRLMEEMENNVKPNYIEYQEFDNQSVELRYPITDPRKPFVCQHCGVGFAREKALESHVRIHAGDSPFECQKCGEMFWDVALMREHVRNKHGDIEDYDDDEDEDYSEEETKYGTFYCSTCGLSFHRQDNLKRHQRVHIKEEYINEHEFSHICNVCGESFPEALDLLAHAEVHARGSEHRCMICGEVCLDDQAVAAHVQAKHGKSLPPNTCMLCGRTCKDRRTLLKHSWEHSKEKNFVCSKCAKTFHNKARLKRHMLSHRNKIVTCDVCGEEFPDGRTLMNHRHSHSSLSGRQFPCRECGKTFGSRSSQQIHIRIHTGERPYGCRFCWKAFADGGTLRKHERIHTGEKPYACAVCPRAFNQRVVLREHIRSHHSGPDPKYSHSVTPYCCQVCSDMFATSQDLIIHLIHHCDLNTAMKRQPQVGPRKYKRRRKLKPHELEMISNKIEEEPSSILDEDDPQQQHQQRYIESDDETVRKKIGGKRGKKNSPNKSTTNINDTNDLYNYSTTIENDNTFINSQQQQQQKSTGLITKSKRNKIKDPTIPSRPKMIHTQKTRVPIETGEDGKIRHKTKTLVTRTQPTEIKSSIGERIRPRTKNVSYHILNSEKLPIATFPQANSIDDDDNENMDKNDDTEQAVNNLLKQEILHEEIVENNNDDVYLDHNDVDDEQPPTEVASEQIVETDTTPIPTNIIRITSDNIRTGRILSSSGNKVVRLVKGGMIISKTKEKNKIEPENILPDVESPSSSSSTTKINTNNIKIEDGIEVFHGSKIATRARTKLLANKYVDPSPLRELAEISVQHAQRIFKCEMCSAIFSDRSKLLDHVPIHI